MARNSTLTTFNNSYRGTLKRALLTHLPLALTTTAFYIALPLLRVRRSVYVCINFSCGYYCIVHALTRGSTRSFACCARSCLLAGSLIGSNFLQHHDVAFDADNFRVGFAPSDCEASPILCAPLETRLRFTC